MSPRTRTTSLVCLALAGLPAIAAAQDVRVEIRVPVEIVAELRAAAHVVEREIRRETAAAFRDVMTELNRVTRTDAFATGQNRNFRAQQTARETHTLALGANGQLELKNISGDITVTAGSGTRASIEIIRTSHGRTSEDAQRGLDRVKAVVTERGNRAVVETQYPNERQPGYSVDVDYQVTAPAGTALVITSISGDVRVTGISGATSVEVISGDVSLQDVTRLSSAKSASGDIVLTNVGSDGSLEAGTMSGDVTIRGLKADRVSIDSIVGDVLASGVASAAASLKSTSGDITFDGTLCRNGRYEFQSNSGTLRLTFAGDTGFDLQATTYSGSIRPDAAMNLKVTNQSRRAMRATFGDGGATVVATTFSGSVILARK
ncbi:MAG TPA: DUF4097 family beta strand repeat-containing protein [Vicinamibacterales bacterium]|nr:DUF4097 family beta strand repeat-containing protein [Vicinamibacterales bacterium]